MKRFVFMALVVSVVFVASIASASTLYITDNLAGQPTYNGYYVGPLDANLDGGLNTPIVCNDFGTTTYVPQNFSVNISTIPSLTYAKFGGVTDALLNYEKAAALIYVMEQTPNDVGPIQFAIWRIFNTSASAGENSYFVWANSVFNPANWDFSGVKIYTAIPPTAQQEFMTGAVPKANTPVPIPHTVWLLGAGLVGLVGLRRKFKK